MNYLSVNRPEIEREVLVTTCMDTLVPAGENVSKPFGPSLRASRLNLSKYQVVRWKYSESLLHIDIR